MEDFIKVLKMFMDKGYNQKYPFHCEHDTLWVCVGCSKDVFNEEELKALDALGVFWSDENECFQSFRYGSC